MTLDLRDLKVIDADTHLVELPDLFTSRVPAALKDRMPHVVEIDGALTWVMEGAELGPAATGGVIARDGT